MQRLSACAPSTEYHAARQNASVIYAGSRSGVDIHAAGHYGYFDGANEIWTYLPRTLKSLVEEYGPVKIYAQNCLQAPAE